MNMTANNNATVAFIICATAAQCVDFGIPTETGVPSVCDGDDCSALIYGPPREEIGDTPLLCEECGMAKAKEYPDGIGLDAGMTAAYAQVRMARQVQKVVGGLAEAMGAAMAMDAEVDASIAAANLATSTKEAVEALTADARAQPDNPVNGTEAHANFVAGIVAASGCILTAFQTEQKHGRLQGMGAEAMRLFGMLVMDTTTILLDLYDCDSDGVPRPVTANANA